MIGIAISMFLFLSALGYAFYRSPERAFLDVYFPILLLLPQIFTPPLPIFHSLGFAQTVILPIFVLFLVKKTLSKTYDLVSVSLTDALVIFYVALCVYSEYYNSENQYAYALFIDKTTSIIFPYFLAKYLLHPRGYSILTIKKIVVMLLIVLAICPYELKMSVNPFLEILKRFFTSEKISWMLSLRFGMVRISGPFTHPILFGVVLGMAIILHYWTCRENLWKKNFSWFPGLLMKKSTLIMFVLIIGLSLTFSRAPLLATLFGYFIASIGFAKKRTPAFIWRMIVILILGIVVFEWFKSFSDTGISRSGNDLAYTGAYRVELLEKYRKYVLEKPIWGWGFATLPITSGLISIDNQYLWLALKHGIPVVCVYVTIIANTFTRLIWKGMEVPIIEKQVYSFAFCLAGAYVTMAISFFSVYMGWQTESLFFILTGWAEGFLLSPSDMTRKQHVWEMSGGKHVRQP